MVTAVLFLGLDPLFINHTLKSLKNLMEKMGKGEYITFGIFENNEFASYFDIYLEKHEYEYVDGSNHYKLYLELIDKYETEKDIKFDTIFITSFNCVYSDNFMSLKFYKNADFWGGDIFNFTEHKPINFLFNHMFTLPNSISVNTNGYYKSVINVENPMANSYLSGNGGTYVKIEEIKQDKIKYITTIPEFLLNLNIEEFTYIKSILIRSEDYFMYNDLSKFLDHSLDQSFLNTLGNNIFHHDKLPIIDCKNSPVFFITSVVNLTNHHSYWNPDERLRQVIGTVKSIKQYVPEAIVIFLEGSLLKLSQLNQISSITDYLVLFNDADYVNNIVKCSNKGMFEIYSITDILKDKLINYTYFAKLGGRYRLNKLFDKEKFYDDKPTFLNYKHFYDINYTYPILYNIPKNYTDKYIDIVRSMGDCRYHNIEHILFCFVFRNNLDINLIDMNNYWVCGYPATYLL